MMKHITGRLMGAVFSPKEEIPKFADTPADMEVLLHTLVNSAIISCLFILLYVDVLVDAFILLWFVAVVAMVFVVTIAIEGLLYKLANQKSKKSVFWKQLNVTNNYLTVPFILMVALGVILSMMPFRVEFLPDIVNVALAIQIIRANAVKLNVLHGLESTTAFSVIYGLCILLAYGLFLLIVFAPMLLLFIAYELLPT